MKEARKKFLLSAMLSVFILLTVMLAVINGMNFTMAAADADQITRMIANEGGRFGNPAEAPEKPYNLNGFGPMGPSSPEMHKSMRYFTVGFDKSGNATVIAYELSAISEEEAVSWAESLVHESTGWTKATYRYRVYESQGLTCVTIIDQGRELLPSFRILMISVTGELAGLIIAFLVLLYVSRSVFRPLEEANRRQKRFIADAEKEFKVPLTVISANTELIERQGGSTEQTQAINRQVRKMTATVRKLSAFSIFEEAANGAGIDLSALLREKTAAAAERFKAQGITLQTDIEAGIHMGGSREGWAGAADELLANAAKFSVSQASVSLKKENDRIRLLFCNDTTLPDGDVQEIFDRFTRLENAKNAEGAGLGLSYVKDWVLSLAGRIDARVEDGIILIRITL